MKKALVWAAGVIVAVGVVALALYFATARHWLAVHTGTVNESGPYYGFWSGFGSDLGEATLIATVFVGVFAGVRKMNCHTKGCWRIGHFPLEGTPFHLCRHHHPDVNSAGSTHEEILAFHHKAKAAAAAALQPPAPAPPAP